MKLAIVLVAIFAVAAYAEPEAEVSAPKVTAGSATQQALAALQGGVKEHNAYYEKALSLCKEELPAAKKIADENNEALYKERTASKEKLRDALTARVADLTKFVKKLYKIRSKLYNHIERVNTIFQKKFLENSHNMAASAKLLHDMGIIKVVPYNPKFNPIKNFAKFDPCK